jgi:hypothetical protein
MVVGAKTEAHLLILVILLPWMPSAAIAPVWLKMNG